jgi:hypothetical protein
MMKEVNIIRVYNLLNHKGKRLQLRLAIIHPDDRERNCGDTGYRWSFLGREIPMPVRNGTWFNGFSHDTMMLWLAEHEWHVETEVNMLSGKAKVYAMPTINGDGIHELEIETSAQKAYDDAIPVALENAMMDIKKAKENGRTSCYISATSGKIPVEVIQSLLNAGYDIKYKVYHEGYGDWFVHAFWDRPNKQGKLFEGGACDNPVEVTIQDYKNA